MTTENVRELIDDLKKNNGLIDAEKRDLLCFFKRVYPKQCKPLEDEIFELVDKWD